jgi:hypothetical protein
MERVVSKESQRVDNLKFKQSGLDTQKADTQKEIDDSAKNFQATIETQESYEEQQSYNRATQLKLYQTIDEPTYKNILKIILRKEDETLCDVATFFMTVMLRKKLATEDEVKDTFSSYMKLKNMMQDPKLEELESLDEKAYNTRKDELVKKLALYPNDSVAQDMKSLSKLLLHFTIFTIQISTAKRNLKKGVTQLETVRKKLIDKKVELAKKVISAVDPSEVKYSDAALVKGKNALGLVFILI